MFLQWNINVSTMFFAQITLFELNDNSANVATMLTRINWGQEPASKRIMKPNSHTAT